MDLQSVKTITSNCTMCGHTKPVEEFYKNSKMSDGCHSWCKPCFKAKTREHSLIKKYGVTLDDYSQMLAAQDGKCAICGTTEPRGRFGVFHVDHCHDTGEVRGLLCYSCNVSLGGFKDDVELLLAAAEYLSG